MLGLPLVRPDVLPLLLGLVLGLPLVRPAVLPLRLGGKLGLPRLLAAALLLVAVFLLSIASKKRIALHISGTTRATDLAAPWRFDLYHLLCLVCNVIGF